MKNRIAVIKADITKAEADAIVNAANSPLGGGVDGAIHRTGNSGSLPVAQEHNCRTVAFPGISTGIYSYPKNEAARIAVTGTVAFLAENPVPETITFVCFDAESLKIYQELLQELT